MLSLIGGGGRVELEKIEALLTCCKSSDIITDHENGGGHRQQREMREGSRAKWQESGSNS
jgi:hypothetical protein